MLGEEYIAQADSCFLAVCCLLLNLIKLVNPMIFRSIVFNLRFPKASVSYPINLKRPLRKIEIGIKLECYFFINTKLD